MLEATNSQCHSQCASRGQKVSLCRLPSLIMNNGVIRMVRHGLLPCEPVPMHGERIGNMYRCIECWQEGRKGRKQKSYATDLVNLQRSFRCRVHEDCLRDCKVGGMAALERLVVEVTQPRSSIDRCDGDRREEGEKPPSSHSSLPTCMLRCRRRAVELGSKVVVVGDAGAGKTSMVLLEGDGSYCPDYKVPVWKGRIK